MKSLELVHIIMALHSSSLFVLCFMPFGRALTEPVDAADALASNGRVVYDQRQSGKYNIHVSIKDVAIIEMDQNEIEDESYIDEDYYYDEDHLTVKPIKFSTAQPVALTSITPNYTTATAAIKNTQLTTNLQNYSPTSPIPIPISYLTTATRSNKTYSANLLADIAATQAFSSNHGTTLRLQNEDNELPATTPVLSTLSDGTRKTTNVIILDSSTANSPSSTHKPAVAKPHAEAIARSKDIPIIQSANEPPLQLMPPNKQYLNLFRAPLITRTRKVETEEVLQKPQENQHAFEAAAPVDDSKIFKFKVRRAHKQHSAPHADKFDHYYPLPVHAQQQQQQQRQTPVRRCHANQYRDLSGNCRIKRSASLLKRLFSMLVTLPFANERNNQNNNND